jgi:hypothetical protein
MSKLYETGDIDNIIQAARVYGNPTAALVHIDVDQYFKDPLVFDREALKRDTLYVTLAIQSSNQAQIKQQLIDFIFEAREATDKRQTYIFTVVNGGHIYSVVANTEGEILITDTMSSKSATCQTIETALKDALKGIGAKKISVDEIRPTQDGNDALQQKDAESCGVFASYMNVAIDPHQRLSEQKKALEDSLAARIEEEFKGEDRPLRGAQMDLVSDLLGKGDTDLPVDLLAPKNAKNALSSLNNKSGNEKTLKVDAIFSFKDNYNRTIQKRQKFIKAFQLFNDTKTVQEGELTIPQIGQLIALKNSLANYFFDLENNSNNGIDQTTISGIKAFSLLLDKFSEGGDISEIQDFARKNFEVLEKILLQKFQILSDDNFEDGNFYIECIKDKLPLIPCYSQTITVDQFRQSISKCLDETFNNQGRQIDIHIGNDHKNIEFKLNDDNQSPHLIQIKDNQLSTVGKSCDEASFRVMLLYFEEYYTANHAAIPIVKITANHEDDAKKFIALALEKNLVPVLADKDVVELLSDEQKQKVSEIIQENNLNITEQVSLQLDAFIQRLGISPAATESPSSPSPSP